MIKPLKIISGIYNSLRRHFAQAALGTYGECDELPTFATIRPEPWKPLDDLRDQLSKTLDLDEALRIFVKFSHDFVCYARFPANMVTFIRDSAGEWQVGGFANSNLSPDSVEFELDLLRDRVEGFFLSGPKGISAAREYHLLEGQNIIHACSMDGDEPIAVTVAFGRESFKPQAAQNLEGAAKVFAPCLSRINRVANRFVHDEPWRSREWTPENDRTDGPGSHCF